MFIFLRLLTLRVDSENARDFGKLASFRVGSAQERCVMLFYCFGFTSGNAHISTNTFLPRMLTLIGTVVVI